jgi:hypothetical protein
VPAVSNPLGLPRLLSERYVQCISLATPDRWRGLRRPADTRHRARKLEPANSIIWRIYKIADKAVRLGAVEASDEATAIEKAAADRR